MSTRPRALGAAFVALATVAAAACGDDSETAANDTAQDAIVDSADGTPDAPETTTAPDTATDTAPDTAPQVCDPDPCSAPGTVCVPDGSGGFGCPCAPGHATLDGACHPACEVDPGLCDFAKRSTETLVSTNGYGAVVWDLQRKKATTFMEHLYRNWDQGVWTRDLLFDTYLGLKTDEGGTWLTSVTPERVGYLDDSHIIQTVHRIGDLRVDTYVWAPMALNRPGLVLAGRVTNEGARQVSASLYSIHNYKLGYTSDSEQPGPIHPDGRSETMARRDGGGYLETGVGGSLLHLPLGEVDHYGCAASADTAANPFERLQAGLNLGDVAVCDEGEDMIAGFQRDFVLQGGESGWLGVVTAFDPAGDAGDTLASALDAAFGQRSPEAALSRASVEWESWRKAPPEGLSAAELKTWRQSESVLRMGQVRETSDKSHGQILASLPPGQWHITWMRDMAYAIAALVRSGHHAEARHALEFVLLADSGLYASPQYTQDVPYRVTITRYFGRGKEETDFNSWGPNIEFDGFGLFLWVLGEYVDASGDETLLDDHWATIDALVADALVALTDPDNGLIRADSSIWEVHWQGKQKQFSYTSLAAARGLCQAAELARLRGDATNAEHWMAAGAAIRDALKAHATDPDQALAQSAEDLEAGSGYRDMAVVEAINWLLFDPSGAVASATLDALEALRVAHGHGYFRNDDGDWYDSQEWVFVDLRASIAHRLVGRDATADALLDWITAQARLNYGLIAELHEPVDATYLGASPMVGFGAGGYILALLERQQARAVAPICGSWED